MTTTSTSKALAGCTKQAYHDAYMQACQKLGDVRKQRDTLLAALELVMHRAGNYIELNQIDGEETHAIMVAAIAAAKGDA